MSGSSVPPIQSSTQTATVTPTVQPPATQIPTGLNGLLSLPIFTQPPYMGTTVLSAGQTFTVPPGYAAIVQIVQNVTNPILFPPSQTQPPVLSEPAQPPVLSEPAQPPVLSEPAQLPVLSEPAQLPVLAEPAQLPVLAEPAQPHPSVKNRLPKIEQKNATKIKRVKTDHNKTVFKSIFYKKGDSVFFVSEDKLKKATISNIQDSQIEIITTEDGIKHNTNDIIPELIAWNNYLVLTNYRKKNDSTRHNNRCGEWTNCQFTKIERTKICFKTLIQDGPTIAYSTLKEHISSLPQRILPLQKELTGLVDDTIRMRKISGHGPYLPIPGFRFNLMEAPSKDQGGPADSVSFSQDESEDE